MAACPCVLLTSCCPKFEVSELVRQIQSVDTLSSSIPLIESVFAYPWSIDTKYYTADVRLCTTKTRTIGDQQFAESVEAFVIYFDSSDTSSFEQVKMWLPYLREISPPVQILVCDQFQTTNSVGMTRTATIAWGLDNGFEVVELNPAVDSDGGDTEGEEEEDQFKETTGVRRIIEALSCHSWSNMVMKDKPSFRSPFFEQLMNSESLENKSSKSDTESNVNGAFAATDSHGGDRLPVSSFSHEGNPSPLRSSSSAPASSLSSSGVQKTINMKTSAEIINGMIGDLSGGAADEDNDSFEKLFDKLQIMKESADEMSGEDRKRYAEQVTLQFWQAVGGNPDEIDGLSDDSEDNDRES